MLYLGPGLDNKKGIAHQNNPYIIQVGTINKELPFMLPRDEKKFHAPENSHPPSPPLSKINGLSLARSYAAEYALASQQRDANTVLSCMAKCVISTLLLSVTINAR